MWDVGVGVSGRRRAWEKSLIDETKIKVPLNSEQPLCRWLCRRGQVCGYLCTK